MCASDLAGTGVAAPPYKAIGMALPHSRATLASASAGRRPMASMAPTALFMRSVAVVPTRLEPRLRWAPRSRASRVTFMPPCSPSNGHRLNAFRASGLEERVTDLPGESRLPRSAM
eukprot:7227980-Alexandrium_andersonii.AAC.1